MRLDEHAAAAMAAGLDRIRSEFEIPDGFPAAVDEAARRLAHRPTGTEHGTGHVDRTTIEFATIDPAGSTDLDQAFALAVDGDDIVLQYAIADVGWFVQPGDPLDTEAWSRGVTVYLPDRRSPLYPAALSEGAASLLPDVDRPAVIFVVRVDQHGGVKLDGAERAVVRSRAKLAYESVRPGDLPPEFAELAARVEAAESARNASRVAFPEQEIEREPDDGFELRYRPRTPAEEQNAALSLAANMAIADALSAAGTGLFRVMPEVDERRARRLRHTAQAFGLDWPKDATLSAFERSLPRDDPRTSAFLLAVRRASGGASYAPYRHGDRPWHAAVAATYAHATAPLRRLQDRYVIEAVLAIANGQEVPSEIEAAFAGLPAAMDAGEQRANRADRAALDLAEAVVLEGCEGQLFEAVVTDEDDRGVWIQITDPAIVARVEARHVDPGDPVRVRLVAAEPDDRAVRFERVS
ncbi:MAG TPA: RNB domain-containing ribonuclease [Ilumatobacteraceae bacterium]|nr:RNB domain-containing ribonuclease [Ilumatobacteraceae bacterium]